MQCYITIMNTYYLFIQNDTRTAHNCGQFSMTRGYWDYCLYQDSSNLDYVSKSWEEKMDIIMERVINSRPPSGKDMDPNGKRTKQY